METSQKFVQIYLDNKWPCWIPLAYIYIVWCICSHLLCGQFLIGFWLVIINVLIVDVCILIIIYHMKQTYWVGNLITTKTLNAVKGVGLDFSDKRNLMVLPVARCNTTECYYVFRFYEPKYSQKKTLLFQVCFFISQEMSSHFWFI